MDMSKRSAAHGKFLWALAAGVFVFLCGAISIILSPPTIAAPWDVFILLDGGYRISLGQVPHSDFSNPIGPLIYELIALGMKVRGVSLGAVAFGNATFLAVASLLAWTAARHRIPKPIALAFVVALSMMIIAVRPLGYDPNITSYAMLYNRYGWVLLSIVMVGALLPYEHLVTKRTRIGQGVLFGTLLFLALATKITFFAAALLFLAFGMFRQQILRSRDTVIMILATMSLGCLIAWGTLGIRLDYYLRDIISAGAAQGTQERIIGLLSAIRSTAPTILILGLLVIALIRLSQGRFSLESGPSRRLVVDVIAIIAVSLIVTSGNAAERGQLPALGVIGLLCLNYVVSEGVKRPHRGLRIAIALATCVAAVGSIIFFDLASLRRSQVQHELLAATPSEQRFDSTNLQDFIVPVDSDWPTAYRVARDVPAMLNDGIRLLRLHGQPEDRVFTVALVDPFSLATDRPPVTGGLLWWDEGFDFSPTAYPEGEDILKLATIVMIPKMLPGQGCCQETVTTMLDIYGPYLQLNFAEVDQSDDWILLRRRP